jgi:chaperonin GroES
MLEPLGYRVVVKPDEAPDKIGRIALPERARVKPVTGTIVAIGEDVISVAVGDRVVYSQFSGCDVKHRGESVVVLGVDEVLCRLHDEDDVPDADDEPDPTEALIFGGATSADRRSGV